MFSMTAVMAAGREMTVVDVDSHLAQIVDEMRAMDSRGVGDVVYQCSEESSQNSEDCGLGIYPTADWSGPKYSLVLNARSNSNLLAAVDEV
jgi:hypothetical protein